MPLVKAAKRAILLSGTPALSRPAELLTPLQALLPGANITKAAFEERYTTCNSFGAFRKPVRAASRWGPDAVAHACAAVARQAATFGPAGSCRAVSGTLCMAAANPQLLARTVHVTPASLRRQTGSKNEEELYKLLTSSVMVRRRKAEVLKDLPPKMRKQV